MILVDNVKAQTVANTFENNWLSQYPTPKKYTHYNGYNFSGPEFS